MPFILARRSQIQNGSVQITDLFPNATQSNLVNDPRPQGPFYVRVPNIGNTGSTRPFIRTNSDGSLEFLRASNGLVAYLIANVEGDPLVPNPPALTIPEAEDIANGIISRVQDGLALELGDINDVCDAVVGGTGLDQGDSTGSVAEVLAILAGEDYIVNAGTPIQDAVGDFVNAVAPGTLGTTMRTLVPQDSSWKISFSEGVLSGLVGAQNANLAFAGVKSATPLLTVYNDDGTIYVG
jgi:hypothetical protein